MFSEMGHPHLLWASVEFLITRTVQTLLFRDALYPFSALSVFYLGLSQPRCRTLQLSFNFWVSCGFTLQTFWLAFLLACWLHHTTWCQQSCWACARPHCPWHWQRCWTASISTPEECCSLLVSSSSHWPHYGEFPGLLIHFQNKSQ